MRKMFTPLVVIVFLLFTSKTYSQIVWTFNDSTAVPSANSYTGINGGAMTSNNNTLPKSGLAPVAVTQTSKSSGYPNFSGTFNLGVAADTGKLHRDSSAYFEFTLTAMDTAMLDISSIGFGMYSTTTGPQKFVIRTSLDAFTDNFVEDTITNTKVWVAKNYTGLVIPVVPNIPVIFRIYGFNGTGARAAGTVNWRIDDITINSPNGVLSATLSSFSTSVISGKISLNWSASNEANLKGFSVEKSSDGRTFREVSYVAASGKSTYSTQDAVSSGTVYYRLKMVNGDGSFTYSKSIPVNASLVASSSLHIYPNPVAATAIVSHPQAGANASLKVTDLNGRILQNYPLQQSAVQTSVNVGKLMSGTYLLVYRDATGKAFSTRLIKK